MQIEKGQAVKLAGSGSHAICFVFVAKEDIG